MTRPGSRATTCGIIGLCWGSVYSAMSRSFCTTARVGEARPVRVDAGAILVGFEEVVGANGDEAAVADFHLAMELDQIFGLAAVLRAKASAAEDEDHRVGALRACDVCRCDRPGRNR